MIRRFALASLVLTLLPSLAFAQGMDMEDEGDDTPAPERESDPAATAEEAPVAETNIKEYKDGVMVRLVQKGFYTRGEFGYWMYLPPLLSYSQGGAFARVGFGGDVHPDYFSMDINFLALGAKGDNRKDITDEYPDENAKIKGGHIAIGAELALRAHIPIGLRWRFDFIVSGGVLYNDQFVGGYRPDGMARGEPGWRDTLAPVKGDTLDFFAGGGMGFEYYTKLRNLSVGMNITGVYLILNGVPGITFAPFLKYTFDTAGDGVQDLNAIPASAATDGE